jgi:hypothetical protein
VDRAAAVRIVAVGYEGTVDPNFKDDPALVEEAEEDTDADDEAEAETSRRPPAEGSDKPSSA